MDQCTTAVRLKGKNKMRKCLVPALALCAILPQRPATAPAPPVGASVRPSAAEPPVQLADRWPRTPPSPAQLEIVNQKRKWPPAWTRRTQRTRTGDGERERGPGEGGVYATHGENLSRHTHPGRQRWEAGATHDAGAHPQNRWGLFPRRFAGVHEAQ